MSMVAPTDLQSRPQALEVQPENIPAELKARPAWVCWRYEWSEKRQRWAKVPYTPYTVKRAAINRPSSWQSFAAAYACYQERRDFFDGVFFALSDDDPYTGGDFDHRHADDRVPPTYAELSPSGNGIRFIGLGSIPSACKKPAGELYNRARFLSITGHKLPGAAPDIRPIQPALDALYAELKGKHSGPAGDKGTPAKHSAAEYDEARFLNRTQREQLIDRAARAAGEETQLAYALRGDYAGFHARWPFVGLYRADGALDESMVRAVVACGLRGRDFKFPQSVVIMSSLFAVYCLAKWGTKDAWHAELERLWDNSPAPKHSFAPRRKPDVIKRPVGRPTHAPEVERFYLFLREQISSAEPIKTGELATDYGIHRRTAITYLGDLERDGRITTVRKPHGLVISFAQSDVIEIIQPESAECTTAAPQIEPTAAPLEETKSQDRVSSDRAAADHITQSASSDEPTAPTPRTLPEAVALVLSQVDPKEFGRKRLPTVRQTLAVVYGYTDLDAVNLEIKRQESIFGKERRECWRMEPGKLFARIEVLARSATRNAGKRSEGKYRTLCRSPTKYARSAA